ncbi:MAG: sugar ABC transporter permease [Planctomycetota bacterium]
MSHQGRRRTEWAGWMFAGPWLVGFLFLQLYPFCASLYWSFCRYDLLSPPRLVGTEHYQRLGAELVSGEGFGRAMWNTAYYGFVSVPLSIALGIGLAIVLSWKVRGQSIFRAICFLPSVVPVVASSVLWIWLLDPKRGLVNYGLSWLGLAGPQWLNDYREAAWIPGWFNDTSAFGSKDALVLMALWAIGNFMVIYLAALADVPTQLYEAAELDGASRVRRFWHVTLPMLTPVILFNLIMGIIQSVQAFTQIYIVSEGTGAPERSTLVLSLHLFLSAFQDLDMGYASAMAWLLFVVLLIATALLFRTSRNWVHYQGGVR